ncbi:MAG: energy transducer TonB [Deltaproteobacteria bacterium]|nr:energy transducer TonB [Deltaproteobacteria bacterium]
MPDNRILGICVALSFLLHLLFVAAASLIPWNPRVAEDVMVVDLADMPRSPDFLPPKPGILEGARPKAPPPPPPPAKAKPQERALKPPRVMEGRVPDLPVNPALPPEERFLPQPPRETREAPPQPAPRAGDVPGPGTSGKSPTDAAVAPKASGGSGKPLKDLNPSLGKMVIAMGETAGRGSGNTAGKTVGTGGKAGEKGEIVEEGGGPTLKALNAPEIQYISYFAGIKRRIELVWGYPSAAGGVEGDVIVDFVIGRSGKLESVNMIRGSGNRALDDEAVGSIRKASPYDPIPSEYKIANLQIRAHFIYTVTRARILR